MITYIKDPNITYTQMAMWVDANAYTDNCDTEKMYKYIYHLAYMLTKKRKFFTKNDEADSFALFVANRVLKRYDNKGQFEFKEDGITPKVAKVKSVLNYLKKTLHLCKIDFERDELSVPNGDVTIFMPTRELGEYIVDNTNIFDELAFQSVLSTIDTIVGSFMNKIPKKKDSDEWYNIYMSCLLTLLNSVTPTDKDLCVGWKVQPVIDNAFLEKMFTRLRYEPPILFHLDKSMEAYIRVLVVEIRHLMAEALRCDSHLPISSDEVAKGIISASFELEEYNEH